ncbi:MAG: hypothetical protein FD174_935 [Geobacteraceae bacterium]|nr:MAG: hypothetical protein FD174_935 [Geobacteraceae bacterium]
MMDSSLSVTLHNLPLAFGLVFGTLMALAGLLAAAVGFVTLRRWFSSRHWPQVPARIAVSEVREVTCFEAQLMFQPEVKYTYAAGGGEATGSNVAFAGKLYGTRGQAEKAISRYPVGMVVMARYNQDDPTQAVLVRRGGLAGLLLTGLGLAMIIAPLAAARQAGLPAGWLGAILAGLAATAALLGWWTGLRQSRARRTGIYPPPGTGSDADVERLVRQGEKMLAVRLYRELHGTDMKTSRLRVEEMPGTRTDRIQTMEDKVRSVKEKL